MTKMKTKECDSVRRLLPLLVGGDLPESKTVILRTHLEKCADCGGEYDLYLFSLRESKAFLSRESRDWPEAEWRRTVQEAVNQPASRTSLTIKRPLVRKSWAYAAGLLVVVMLGLFILQSRFRENPPGTKPGSTAVPETGQEIVAVTIVSPESGLKVNWFLNKNFEWEDNK